VVLIFAILWLGHAPNNIAKGAGDRVILALLWLAPVALWLLARYSQFSLWPLLLAICLVWVLLKARRESYSAQHP
jgi:putative effector of murein hydrolase